jgi:hypothetical protein
MKNIRKIDSNIYITFDEEIKEDSWVTNGRDVFKPSDMPEYSLEYANKYWKKIILTTDQSLDGVQAIDNEFLEWFIKNPNCEEVKVEKEFIQTPDNLKDGFYYKIIIPKEEPTQETLEEAAERIYPVVIKPILDVYDDGVSNQISEEDITEDSRESFIEGAKWQAERMYSAEDINIMFDTLKENSIDNKVTITNVDLFISSWKKKL